MARFKFRLQPLLKLREMEQERRERQLGRQVQRMLLERERADDLAGRIDAHYNEIRQASLVGEVRIGDLVVSRRYLNHLHVLRQRQVTAVREAERDVETARFALAEAKKQTDIMDKLRDRAYRRYVAELRRKETRLLDDVANSKVAWRRQQDHRDTIDHEDPV